MASCRLVSASSIACSKAASAGFAKAQRQPGLHRAAVVGKILRSHIHSIGQHRQIVDAIPIDIAGGQADTQLVPGMIGIDDLLSLGNRNIKRVISIYVAIVEILAPETHIVDHDLFGGEGGAGCIAGADDLKQAGIIVVPDAAGIEHQTVPTVAVIVTGSDLEEIPGSDHVQPFVFHDGIVELAVRPQGHFLNHPLGIGIENVQLGIAYAGADIAQLEAHNGHIVSPAAAGGVKGSALGILQTAQSRTV